MHAVLCLLIEALIALGLHAVTTWISLSYSPSVL